MGVFEVLLVLGGVAALHFYNQARSAASLVFYPGNISGLSFEGFSPVVDASILIQNTSNTDFIFNSVAASAYSDGILVGNVSNFTPVTILRNTEGLLPIKIRLLLLSAANDVVNAIQTGHIQKTLKFDGSVNANGVPVPLELEYQIGL